MAANEESAMSGRIQRMRSLTQQGLGTPQYYEAAHLALSVLHDTVGGSHPICGTLTDALQKGDWGRATAGARAVITLHDEGSLTSPRLRIAHEIEGDLLDIAQQQVQAAEKNDDAAQKQTHLAIAAFLAGAALEDGLRRLCDARAIAYDAQRTSLSKLQAALYRPSQQIEIISNSDSKQITAWGDTRNKADHGKFSDITYSEVWAMTIGVRAFLDRRLP
jgi:hypothetical protein